MVSRQPCRLDDPADCQALIELALGTCGRVDVLFVIANSRGPGSLTPLVSALGGGVSCPTTYPD
jgi:hypothetical protein